MILCTCAHKIRTTFSPDPDIITKNRLNVDHNAATYMLLADEQKKNTRCKIYVCDVCNWKSTRTKIKLLECMHACFCECYNIRRAVTAKSKSYFSFIRFLELDLFFPIDAHLKFDDLIFF